jgi:hypothetical protein
MKFGVIVLGTAGLSALSNLALAQAPPPRVGFQMALRTGYSVPLGSTQKDISLSSTVSGQMQFIYDLGAKPIPQLFLGGYVGTGLGEGYDPAGVCKSPDADCSGRTIHLGVQAQYHILPGGWVNPWLGYGLGYELLTVETTQYGTSHSSTFTGFQFARFMGGADVRLSRIFGLGLFVDLAMGSYGSGGANGAPIANTATHEWLTFGARFIVFP